MTQIELETTKSRPEVFLGQREVMGGPQRKFRSLRALGFILPCIFAVAGISWYMTTPPREDTAEIVVDIKEGSTLRQIASDLKDAGVIRSPLLFSLFAEWTNSEKLLGSGEFKFLMPKDAFEVLRQVRRQDHGIVRLKITIPEGTTLSAMGEIFAQQLPNFDKQKFYAETNGKEGYLFPDTYFFFANATSGVIIRALEENFVAKTGQLQAEALGSRKNWNNIMTMASLIEEEAVKDEDRKIISGILWTRLGRGMRLQVDAPFMYLLAKPSSEITADDLSYDSPYNTYRYSGLPPAPISNPGLLAIDAALHPTKSDFLFYLSDKVGIMHYAKTFEEHKLNKAKFLY